MVNLPWRTGLGAKAEHGGGVTRQLPRAATSTQQRFGKAQRLRVGVGWQANLPNQGRWWILELTSGAEGSIQNWIAPPCCRRSWPFRAAAERQCSCHQKTTALNIFMSWQSYLTSQFQLILWTEGPNTTQVSHLVRPHQSFWLYANYKIRHIRNNSRTFTKRWNILWFLNLLSFIVFLFLFPYY
jgi:hypothetical protein